MLYAVNEKVWHTSTDKIGTVLEYVGGEEKRYYVRHSGFIWSVPEAYLEMPKTRASKIRYLHS